jgi:NAD-dependent deacetylase
VKLAFAAKTLGRVFVITGAGISAESGIPTFRGAGGLWRNFDPTNLATEAAFRRDPELVWTWYRERRRNILDAQPNAAHIAVVEIAARAREFLLLTQNVDDLHARAKWNDRELAPEQLVQIHGDIFITRCSHCDFRERDVAHDVRGVPKCPRCGQQLRPGVVWFGENLPETEIACVSDFLQRGACDVTLVIGTTALFPYIVQWALDARGAHGELIEINPEETPISEYATLAIREPAALALPRWLRTVPT